MSNMMEITAGDVVVIGYRGQGCVVIGRNVYESVDVPLREVPSLLQAIQQVADFVGGEV